LFLSPAVSPNNERSIMPAVDRLVQRLSDEVAAATERIQSLQTNAAKQFIDQEQRFLRFASLTDRVQTLLQPRIEVFTKLNVFKDIQQTVSLELRTPETRGFHTRTTTLSVPFSEECPALVELTFCLGHDGPVENAILQYELKIVPIYIKFDGHDQLVIPLDKPNEDAVAGWIDDKLVSFTRTYFELYFTEQYQKQSLETDPVMDIRFPRAFAAGKKEHQGRTYYFYTKASFEDFEKAPSDYVKTTQ
jgi:YHS domain-containing protein